MQINRPSHNTPPFAEDSNAQIAQKNTGAGREITQTCGASDHTTTAVAAKLELRTDGPTTRRWRGGGLNIEMVLGQHCPRCGREQQPSDIRLDHTGHIVEICGGCHNKCRDIEVLHAEADDDWYPEAAE